MEYVLIFLTLCAVNIVAAKECDEDKDCEEDECCIAKSFMHSDHKECKKYLKEGDICRRNIKVMKEMFGFTFGVTPCGPDLTCATTEELLYTVDEEYDVYSTRCFKKFKSFETATKSEDVTGKKSNEVSSKVAVKVTSEVTDEVKSKATSEVSSKGTDEVKSKTTSEVKSKETDEVKSKDTEEVTSENQDEATSVEADAAVTANSSD